MKNKVWQIGLFLPAAIFTVYVVMALAGIIASVAGAGPVFYCTIYCKVGLAVLIAVVAAVLFLEPVFPLKK